MQRMTKTDLSDTQIEVLKFIDTFMKKNGYSPTLHEISTAMGWAADSTAYNSLEKLVRLGYIRREKGKVRSIKLLRKASYVIKD